MGVVVEKVLEFKKIHIYEYGDHVDRWKTTLIRENDDVQASGQLYYYAASLLGTPLNSVNIFDEMGRLVYSEEREIAIDGWLERYV